ncbi:ABC transporter ATP-binding protein [Haploplasma axanthum]|nr:ABC transporter ATP-binding protein [Haploplasma axanthum]
MVKLFKYLKPYIGTLIITVLLTIFYSFGIMYLAKLMAKMIEIGPDNKQEIIKITVRMLLIAIASGVAMIISTYTSAYVGTRFSQNLRYQIIKKKQDYSLSDMEKIGTASLMTRTTNDVSIIQLNFIMILQMLLKAPVMIVIGLILAFNTNAKIATIMTISLLVFIIVAVSIGRKVLPMFDVIQVQYDDMTHSFREVITGVRVIRAFRKEKHEEKKINNSASSFALTGIRINKKFALLIPLLILMINLGILSIISYGGFTAKSLSDLTNMTAMIEYLTIIMFNILMAMFVILEIPRAQTSAKRINKVLDLKVSVSNGKISEIFNTNIRELEFKNVSYTYHDSSSDTLKNLNFKVHSGETIAIVGSTGSGKSTVSKLIPRFFDVTFGQILLNGIDISTINQTILRDNIGYIPQKAFLFRGTIASNLKFGNKDASYDDLVKASKIAQAHDFIINKDDGYDSYVAQGGTNLSGGQKQRLCIARALVKRPYIYVFDDSFSALDFKTDSALRKQLKENIKDAITVIIAQRITTIMDADKIVVLEDGKMVGLGTHHELIKSNKAYLDIALSQMTEKELFGDLL